MTSTHSRCATGIPRSGRWATSPTSAQEQTFRRGWDAIPGARGCSTEACDFRDHFADLRAAGAAHVFGMSSQDPDYHAEVVERLHLPFVMLSDQQFVLADALDLPTFAAPG